MTNRADDYDEIDARTRANFETLERQMWPVLAALGNEVDADQLPTRTAAEWVWARSLEASEATAAATPGKWLIERGPDAIDNTWQFVHGAVAISRLWAAKASGARRATFWGDKYLIAVYVPGGAGLEAARAARAVLRELGVVESIRYLDAGGDELLRE